MYNFQNDYAEGAHPVILQKLLETNSTQQAGYGDDDYSIQAKELLRTQMANPDAAIFFLSGGTQTNLIAISSLLRGHEAVISAKSGHISTNETGAIEATGHKVITVETTDGKLTPTHIHTALQEYTRRPHVVKPAMVYISNVTEMGTIYSKAQLEQVSACCKENGLLLFMDGARLGHALTALTNDLTLQDISRLTDLFYIGGTKNGALIGEALVFNKSHLATDFLFIVKQRGAMLAKGRLLGIQFLELFKNDLYFTLARHANTMAGKIATAFAAKGYPFLSPPATNVLFPILPQSVITTLSKKYLFYTWKPIDETNAAVRIITSWATEEAKVDEFIADIMQA